MEKAAKILDIILKKTNGHLEKPFIKNREILRKIEFISHNIQNRAGVRLIMSCLLAKLDDPKVDVRKPYTEIGSRDSFSGRTYDEAYVGSFITKHHLPCNPTTAFLTPALRNRNIVLTPKVNLVGRPPEIYQYVLDLLELVFKGFLAPAILLAEIMRQLVLLRDENQKRIKSLLKNLGKNGSVPLSGEDIIKLIEQHLNCKGASRLPVLIVAAAYNTIGNFIQEKVLPIFSHNSADKQTGALGDIQITLINDENVVTSYEMKMKKVTKDDIDIALQKISGVKYKIDNYIFITTDIIDDSVKEYAKSLYEQTGGIEIVVLDCISFLRHFIHLFHRFRLPYLEEYQKLVMGEADSAVSQPLKEAFLALRQATESAN
ncbi:restriction endonuclease, SacI family [Patescibacteria group bacterium]|nr:MAG: restriction endonuclease, SacI family [Patescibacteria group bacterium]